MLSSKNRSLKRRARIGAFFIIVGGGCVYRANEFLKAAYQFASSDQFLTESPLVPESVRQIYLEAK